MSENDEVLETFERLCYWLNSAFARVMEIEREQPNYVAALDRLVQCSQNSADPPWIDDGRDQPQPTAASRTDERQP